MQIKNLVVDQKEYIMSEIERFLCVEGISYVKVDNEIHCPNLILRFYEFRECLDALIAARIEEEEMYFDGTFGFLRNMDETALAKKIFCRPEEILDLSKIAPEFLKAPKKNPYPKVNKKKQLQMENRKYMQRLK